jgi:hypothetical protein
MSESESESEREPVWPLVVLRLMYLLYVATVIWLSLPPHTRQAIRMRAAANLRTAAGGLARRAGEASMREELRSGRRLYSLPYLLSRVRDRAGELYERERPT